MGKNLMRDYIESSLNCSHAVNFREIRMGNIAANTLFRSSHPIKDNKQEKSISLLASKVNIKTVINLCDTMSGITYSLLLLHGITNSLKAGVDRTGFVCMVIESFMGAALNDVINDYLKSFNSIFESSIYEAQKTDATTAMQILSAMSDSQIINEQNLQHIAETYLRSRIGLSAEEVELLRLKLSEKRIIGVKNEME